MKALAILAMLFVVLIIFGAGFLYFFGFVMSFDAPGSTTDPDAWRGRAMMFLPVIFCVVILVLAFLAFRSGHYGRSLLFSGALILAVAGLWTYLTVSSIASASEYQAQRREEAELAKKYPVQKFTRMVEGGSDTIIIWPNRIVAYRLYIAGLEKPWGGPLGDLNETRDTLQYYAHVDTKIRKEELDEFADEKGRKFTELYKVK